MVRILGDTHYDGSGSVILVHFSEIEGAETDLPSYRGSYTAISIFDDDPSVFLGTLAADDYFQVVMNGSDILNLDENDGNSYIDDRYTTRILEAPLHGTLASRRNIFGRRDAGAYLYTPDRDFSGRDSFRYEFCYGACTQAQVLVDVKAFTPVTMTEGDRSGRMRVGMDSLPLLAQASFLPSKLVGPQRVVLDVQPDPTPREGWDADSNIAWVIRTLPASADGATTEYRIVPVVRDADYRRFRTYVGVDTDGDRAPSLAEKRCEETRRYQVRLPCETTIHVASEPVDYWVAARSLNGDFARVDMEVYEVPMDRPDGNLVASGPGRAAARAPVHAEISWRDDSLLPGDKRLGFVRVRSDADTVVGDFPFWVDGSVEQMGLPLGVDEPRTFHVGPATSLDRVFIDVPEGATRLEVASHGDDGMDFHLARHAGGGDPQDSTIAPAPEAGNGAVSSTGSGNERQARVEGAALLAGRWYVVPRNTRQEPASVTLSAAIQAVAPIVRSGSYYNPARPGSGLMLYPAGGQRVGLWYTYEAVSFRPTWYYLQAPQPDATGIWRSPIYRQVRAGGVSRPTQVGQATVTPMGPDVFAFTYTLNGETGSEIYSPLGRGCPSLYGQPLDASSHWFNPMRDGSGYSVQFWRNYEFVAMFDYDEQGSPLHLTAERTGFAGESELLPLQRLMGACPTCDYVTPTRQPAGVLHRILRNGGLERVQVDASYEESWPFAPASPVWSVIDRVQLLGGEGTKQGCTP